MLTPRSLPRAKLPTSPVAPENGVLAVRLGAGDLLEVSVYNVPELSTKAESAIPEMCIFR